MRIIYHDEFDARVIRTPAGDVHLILTEEDRTESHVFPFGVDAANETAEEIKLKASGLHVPGEDNGPVN